jgi:hypothetical protein
MRMFQPARLLSVVLILLALALPAGSVSAQVQGSVTPNTEVLPGAKINIVFSGFPPNSEVVRWVSPPDNARTIPFPGDIVTDNNGVAAWQYTVPSDARAGTWAIMARAKKAPSSTRATAARFEVAAIQTTVSPTASVAPTSGKPQTRFAFTAPGFQVNQRVYAWANGPNDENIDLNLSLRADNKGVATWRWTAPADIASGHWRMVIRDTPNPDQQMPSRYLVTFTIEP